MNRPTKQHAWPKNRQCDSFSPWKHTKHGELAPLTLARLTCKNPTRTLTRCIFENSRNSIPHPVTPVAPDSYYATSMAHRRPQTYISWYYSNTSQITDTSKATQTHASLPNKWTTLPSSSQSAWTTSYWSRHTERSLMNFITCCSSSIRYKT